jgi:hypothetical protein
MDTTDTWSRTIARALDVIFAKYPARTGVGVVLGCALLFLVRLFEPALRALTIANFAGAPWWGWLSIGVLAMHLPTIGSLFRQKSIGNDAIDLALELIERGNFTPAERRQHYRRLIDRVASNVALSQTAQNEVKQIEKEIGTQNAPTRDE